MTMVVETNPDLIDIAGLAQWHVHERLETEIQKKNLVKETIADWLEKQLAFLQLILINAATVPSLREEVEEEIREMAINSMRHSPFMSCD